MTDHEKEAYERGIKLDIEEDDRDEDAKRQTDLDEEVRQFATLTPEQTAEREDIVKAIGQRANALMRYDGKDPALVASALLWCGISMYVQGAPDLTREGMLMVCGSTFDAAVQYIAQIKEAEEKKRGGGPT